MNRATIHIHDRHWRTVAEESIVRRIALAILGTDAGVRSQDPGWSWPLHNANDWWCGPRTETADGVQIELAYRYGMLEPELLEAWRVALEWVFRE